MQFSNSNSRYLSKRNKNIHPQRDLYASDHSNISSWWPEIGKQPKCPSMDRYSIINLYKGLLLRTKGKKLLINMKSGINLKNMMLSKEARYRRCIAYFPFMWNPRAGKINLTHRNQKTVASGKADLTMKEH